MTHTPNEEQDELITSIDGVYLVDAGAGTGKTFTIVRRYAHILQETDTGPDDILLTTYTENGAETMKERIINHCDYDLATLRDAPIATFHGYCHSLLRDHGFHAPQHLGIEETLPSSARIIENKHREKRLFRRYIDRFRQQHDRYDDLLRITDPGDLLTLLKELGSSGIFPKADGWYRNGEKLLDGDREAFITLLEEVNEPNVGATGPINSDLKNRLSYDSKLYTDNAPTADEIEEDDNRIDEHYLSQAFDEDREHLKEFIHDIYHGYIRYLLQHNLLTFQTMMMFAYVLLVEDDAVREETSFQYVMLDEFQDTNEIQFKLALLLAGEGNLAAVGDWKQSIFGFQYASVENITRFRERLQQYIEDLNSDRERIPPMEDPTDLELTRNYRSGQAILDAAEKAFTIEATRNEDLDTDEELEDVTSLQADRDTDSTVEAFHSEEEGLAILAEIRDLIEEGHDPGEIAILTRKRSTAIDIQAQAEDHGIPAGFEGGVELFRTDPALLLLAWLRILGWGDEQRGWAVVLEEAGYSIEEIDTMIDGGRPPAAMQRFREDLDEHTSITTIARIIFDRYGIDNGYTTAILDVIGDLEDDPAIDRTGIVRYIEDAIDRGTTHDVDDTGSDDQVTITTIHGAKGREFPVVFLAGMNTREFPSTRSGATAIEYEQPIGLRQRKVYAEDPVPYIYDSWQAELLSKVTAGRYDEERRLLYVAMTRAEDCLYLTATTDRQSPFFTGLPLEAEQRNPDTIEPLDTTTDHETVTIPTIDEERPIKRAVSALKTDSSPDEEEAGGRGPEFGDRVHTFAQRYVEGQDPDAGEQQDFEHLTGFIDGLEGELRPEATVLIPLQAEGGRSVLQGVIDLLAVTEETARIIDYKTDTDRSRQEQYRLQLSAYFHALQDIHPEKDVSLELFYTAEGETVELEPVSREELVSNIQE